MIPFPELSWRVAAIGRWVALILGTLLFLFFLALVVGEGMPPIWRLAVREQLYALSLAGLFIGLVLAWRWEGWGATVTLAGWVLLAILAKKPAWDAPLLVPALVALVHLGCWWRLRGPAPAVTAGAAPSVQVCLVIGAPLAVFVLLCANELFGMPPLFSSTPRPVGDFAGAWTGTLTTVSNHRLPQPIPVRLTIVGDGAVSGTIGDAPVNGGALIANRSWFGRLMHWRTDYLIQGRLSKVVESYGGIAGDRFTCPLEERGGGLRGSIFLSNPGLAKPLGIHLVRQ